MTVETLKIEESDYWNVGRSRFEKVNFQTSIASQKYWKFKMDAIVNDFQAKDDDSFYENMVDELHNPTNYEFLEEMQQKVIMLTN